ncbi:MAG: hypothetical protein HYT20_01860 [Candidatus Nealsonbacteria bacterium]|nr:hypothetical protein [Candidatus Nealsonbacteria bacterium]
MFFLEIIFSTLLFFSLLGMGFILFKKIPALVKLPESESSKSSIISEVKKIVKKIPGSEKFDYELYLQKMLSKVRVLTIKTKK